jgi:hypothetical protein
MKKLILVFTVIAALAFLGANLSTMPHLSAPRMVDPGGQLYVKGIGFEPGVYAVVCVGSDCNMIVADPFGGFVQGRVAPDAVGPVVITAVQTFNGGRRGIGTRQIKASTVTFVGERDTVIGIKTNRRR